MDNSRQFDLLLQQKYSVLNMLDKSNDTLDDKASKMLQSSSLIIALTGLLASPLVGASLSGVSAWLVMGILIAFMLMVGLSIVSIAPKAHYLAGTQDWQKSFEQYILVSAEAAFGQVLSDCLEIIDAMLVTNNRKAWLVKISAILLILQIGALLIFIISSVQ